MQPAFHYKAFLSYSHRDHKQAAWLHNALERYRLPAHLVGEATRSVSAGGRLGRIFRDRDELPVADDLTAEVRKALASSECMIVLCSPRSAASRWVNKEVLEFKKLRGEAFVLPIVIDGVPGTGAKDNDQECFPPALRYRLGPDGSLSKVLAEPIAADIRKEADGKVRALQKLIAGLLGLGLDRLVERELQRKQRRVMAVTATSVIAMLFMGALTYQAVMARQEAEFQRGQAEDLVEFMLTDLRGQLEPVGRLDVLDAVGDKVVAYYNRAALEDLPDDSVGRRAKAYHLLGEIEKNKNNPLEARALFEQARDATADLLIRDPDNEQRIYEHAQSVFWMGYVNMDEGAYEAAEKAFMQYRDYGARLVKLQPENPDWQMELAWGYNSVGALQETYLDQPRKALRNFQRQEEILLQLIKRFPEAVSYKMELSENLAWQADVLANFSHARDVLELREKQRSVLAEILQADPLNKTILWQLLHSNRASAYMNLFMGQYDATLSFYMKAQEQALQLVENDPENKKWALNLVQVWINIAYTRLQAGHVEEAANLLSHHAQEMDELLGLYDGVTEPVLAQKLARDLLRAEIDMLLGRPEVAVESSARLEKKLQEDWSGILDAGNYETMLARLHLLKARALKAGGKSTEAELLLLKFWQGAFTEKPVDKSIQRHPRSLVPLAVIADAVGDTEMYRNFGTSLQSRGFLVPDWQ